jgi:hypothetical protein
MLNVGASDHGLSFYWAGNRDLAGAANATCLIKRKSEGTWTQMWSLAAEPLATPFVYRERCLSLTTYVGDSIQFAFRVQGTNGPDFAVDDVAVGDFVATATPTNENCASAMDLPAGTFSIAGVTTYGSDDVDPGLDGLNTCVGDLMDGPDVVYRVNGLVGDTLSVRLDADWSPALYRAATRPPPAGLAPTRLMPRRTPPPSTTSSTQLAPSTSSLIHPSVNRGRSRSAVRGAGP